MQQTALLVEVPEAEPLVSAWRRRYDPAAARGVPAHVTVLFPFVAPGDLDDDVLASVAAVAASFESFDFELAGVDEFPGVVWLHPTPEQAFRDVTRRLWETFPDHPPYEGRHPDAQPHLTVAMVTDADQATVAARVRADLEDRLPISSRASRLSLYVNRGDDRWRREHVAAFADPTLGER